MTDMNRREAIQTISLATLALACGDTDLLDRARSAAGDPDYEPEFFTPHEWRTVHVLADLVIPADDRSGSATDAGVPQFMDVVIQEFEDMRTPMRGGLAWLDHECHDRHGTNFVDCDVARQTALLDLIAWPDRAPEVLEPGVAFFMYFRDFTASGFWSSRMGIEDLGYTGNRPVLSWDGCPPEVLAHLGLRAT